jgi:hypothetical protein
MTDPIAYIRQQLADGVAYVILPNHLAQAIVDDDQARVMELERDNERLRAEIETLERMRHTALEEKR